MPFALDSLGEGSMENTRGEHDSLSQEAMSSPDNSRSKDSCFIKSLLAREDTNHLRVSRKKEIEKKKKESESYLG
jgi:hypothetical protein